MSFRRPLQFEPQFMERIWGGEKIRTRLGKDFGDLPNCGESWEISGVPGHTSICRTPGFEGMDLAELIESDKAGLLGPALAHHKEFPLLIKFIDAADDLSIQVHPGDELARKKHGSAGKTEMWYVFDADPGAELIVGWEGKRSKSDYEGALAAGILETILHREKVKPGDVFHLPAGRIHAIGKGVCVAEIQQTSDVTYRVYDFNRLDAKTGKPRQLHLAEALDAMDFSPTPKVKTDYVPTRGSATELAACPYYRTDLIWVEGTFDRNLENRGRFTILVGVEGKGTLAWTGGTLAFGLGDTVLLPADLPSVRLTSDGTGPLKLLETWIPDPA